MKPFMLAVFVVVVCGIASSQQPYPGVEIFGGYSFTSVDYAGQRANFNGWEGSFTGNLNRHFGLTADFSQGFGSTIGGSDNRLFLLFGPQAAFRSTHTNLFLHALFGAARKDQWLKPFAAAFGGGFDYALSSRVSLRVVQADYLMTRFQEPPCTGPGCGNPSRTQNNIRVSAGLVFQFDRNKR